MALALLTTMLTALPALPNVYAQSARTISADASCAVLAGVSPSATNGPSWGRTVLPGHGAAGGWFGVDVCSNGVNMVAGGGGGVSCTRLLANGSAGCGSGQPTSDGYGWTFQCVELVDRFAAWAFGDNPGAWLGNAPDLWLPANHPSDFVMYPNGSSHAPVAGDILVWGSVNSAGQPWPAGPDGQHGGHIGVVASVKNGIITTAEQNVLWGTQDHPSDTLALAHSGSSWIVSGTARPAYSLPTYRWPSTMGSTRATYGWLHSTKNTGVFPSTHTQAVAVRPPQTPGSPAPAATAAPAATPPAQQKPVVLPPLTAGTVVSNGAVVDLTWREDGLLAGVTSPQTGATPSVHVRSLGSPPGTTVASGQTPASVVMSDGTRHTFVIGSDGSLYAVRIAPTQLGPSWASLGIPGHVKLTGSPSAALFSSGIAVVALGTDGSLWWRAGPAGEPGNWLMAGRPRGVTLTGSPLVVGTPGTGDPLVLALGTDGVLYERLWSETGAGDGTGAGWSDWLGLRRSLAGVKLTAPLLAVPEVPQGHATIGLFTDTPLDVFALDTAGHIWRLRLANAQRGWTTTQVAEPAPATALLGGVAVPASDSGVAIDGYTPSATGSSTASAALGSLVHLYLQTATSTYEGALLADPATSGATTPVWDALTAPKSASTSPTTASGGVAIALAPAASVLVSADAKGVRAIGTTSAVSTMLPGGDTSQKPGSGAAAVLPLSVGAATGAFSDAFTGMPLDARWSLSAADAQATQGASGLSLRAGASGTAALLQQAVAGDATLSVHVGMPAGTPADATAGLVLYLDESTWLTLGTTSSGAVSVCAQAEQKSACGAPVSVGSGGTLWLRITRTGGVFTASASSDGSTWHGVGSWAPAAGKAGVTTSQGMALLNGPDTTVGTAAYTAWGVYVAKAGKVAPEFTGFTVGNA